MKARIVIEYKGKRYRMSRVGGCQIKGHCDLFKKGVCDTEDQLSRMPCYRLSLAFADLGLCVPYRGYKEIKK